MAKCRYRPWDRTLVPELEGRAEALAGSFKAQEVANTLWAYATMGREPGAGVMRGLEGRAEALAGTFNAQDVANTLWAYATRHEARRACRVGGRQRQQQAAEAQRGRHSEAGDKDKGKARRKNPGDSDNVLQKAAKKPRLSLDERDEQKAIALVAAAEAEAGKEAARRASQTVQASDHRFETDRSDLAKHPRFEYDSW